MTKALKIFLILSVFISLLLCFNISFATSDDAESSEEQTSSNVIKEDSSNTSALSTLSPTSSSSITGVSTMNSYSQANLELNNILCIILIAIGVLIILLSIAILIRLKK